MTQFKHLFTEVEIGNTKIKNRILVTAHQTRHVVDGLPTEDMIAYHEARAKGGVGLIILEAAAVHESAKVTSKTIRGYDPRIIDEYRKIADAIHPYGTKLFAQLFHGGREIVASEYRNAAIAPSAVPSLRFANMPRPMSVEEIKSVIDGFATSALYAKQGGLDGVEILAAFGYLPSLFMSEATNQRTDEYGGSFENRMRFMVELLERIWEKVGDDFTVGLRLSSDEKIPGGLSLKDTEKIVEYLSENVRVDFINIAAGESSTYAGATHIVPPSPMKQAYLANDAFAIRMAGAIPTFVGSRILDPVDAEKIIASGKADMVGMTRATIVDPDMPNKAKNGELQAIDACIGCLQACIGHYYKGLIIGCVQRPETGHERIVNELRQKQTDKKSVLIIGAGPGGLEAAVTAAEANHDVVLVEKAGHIGGMLNLMRKAPLRHEMAESMIDNYTKQLARTNVEVRLNTEMTKEDIIAFDADVVICATGSRVYQPKLPGIQDERIIYIDELFNMQHVNKGERVVVFDLDGAWPGVEGAIFLAEKGCDVTFITARMHGAEMVHQYLRNMYLKKLEELEITVIPQHEFAGIKDDHVVYRSLLTYKEKRGDWDKVVLSLGRVPNHELYEAIKHEVKSAYLIGDSLAPRTIEEATYEGLFTILNLA